MKMTVQAPGNVLLMVTVQSQTSAPWRPIVTLGACVRTTHVDPPVPTGPAMENCNATFKRAFAKSPPNAPTMLSVPVIGLSGWPMGEPCANDDQCPGERVCANTGRCVEGAGCAINADCDNGRICGDGACVVNCVVGGCPGNQVCDANTGFG